MTNQAESSSGFMDTLGRQRRQLGILFVVLAVICAGLTIWLFNQPDPWEYRVLGSFIGVLALCFGGAGLYQLMWEPTESRATEARVVLLVLGGLVGFFTWVFSLLLLFSIPPAEKPNQWWNTISGGLEAWQGDEGWRLWVFVGVNVGALALMFFSLLLGRTEERTSPVIRRLIYGYNAALGGLLLAAILMVVLVFLFLSDARLDWTESGIYSLSDQSKTILEELKQRDDPLQIYVLQAPGQQEVTDELKVLLGNIRSSNDQIEVKFLARDRDAQVEELVTKYGLPSPVGMLLVHGEYHEFLSLDDMFRRGESEGGQRPQFAFAGEDVVLSAVDYLMKEKTRPTIYVTQGNGELDLFNKETEQIDVGLSELKSQLEKKNYTVKGLILTKTPVPQQKDDLVADSKVPADAHALVIPRPKRMLSPEFVEAVRNYMMPREPGVKKGKLIVLFDVVGDPEGRMLQTGLEPLVAELGVEMDNERILSLSRSPLHVRAAFAVSARQNPLVAAFAQTDLPPFYNVRAVQPKPGERFQMSPMQPQVLLGVPNEPLIFTETNLLLSPTTLVADIRKLPVDKLAARVLRRPLPIAVMVTENATPNPHMMPPQPPGKGTPRMIVFGDASFVCNEQLSNPARAGQFNLFYVSLAWLREDRGNLGIPPKQRNIYVMSQKTSMIRLLLAPLVLILAGIIGLGAGVWVVRRR